MAKFRLCIDIDLRASVPTRRRISLFFFRISLFLLDKPIPKGLNTSLVEKYYVRQCLGVGPFSNMQWGERERESEAICFPCGYRALFFRANTSSRGKRMKIRFLNAKESFSNSRVIISLLAVLALVLCSAVGARAQVTTAAVRGTVADE